MKLTAEGLKLLLDFEVGGGLPYYRKFLQRPTWPGYSSGVTIGIGFDLGYSTAEEFRLAWGHLLADDNTKLLAEAIGIRAQLAREWLSNREDVRGIEIPWEKALTVFEETTVPRFYQALLKFAPESARLPGQCRDALLSLVFNRGTSTAGQSRLEMAQIQGALKDGRPNDVPGAIRSMRRLWPHSNPNRTTQLQDRRMAEALLFEQGLRLS